MVTAGGLGGDARASETEGMELGSMPVAGGTGPALTITPVATASAIESSEKSNAAQCRDCIRQVAQVVRSLRLSQG